MPYKIAICDDESTQCEYIASLVDGWASKRGNRCDACTFLSAESFLFTYADDPGFDILLLDVEMPGISGIELAKQLRRDGCRAEIVFVSSHFEFVGEGYDVDALHFLTKPITAARLAQVLDKAAARLAVDPPSILINCDGETVKLYESDIFSVESALHTCIVQTRDAEYRVRESITAFAQKLSDDFYRTHRSYLANLRHVTRISRTSVTVGGAELPLARGKYDDIHRAFIEHN